MRNSSSLDLGLCLTSGGPYDLLTPKNGHREGRARGTAFWVWLPGWVCHEGDHEIRTPSQGSAQCLAHSRCAVKGATLFLLCFQSLGTAQVVRNRAPPSSALWAPTPDSGCSDSVPCGLTPLTVLSRFPSESPPSAGH